MIPTDEQWRLLQLHFPPHPKVGRPSADDRLVLEAILWRQVTASPWRDLPARYPAFQVCHRRARRWRAAGLLRLVTLELERDLRLRGSLCLRTCFQDGSLSLLRQPGGIIAVVPGPNLQGQWQFLTAMFFIAPGLTALNRAFRKSGCRAVSLQGFQVYLADYLNRLLAVFQKSGTPPELEPH